MDRKSNDLSRSITEPFSRRQPDFPLPSNSLVELIEDTRWTCGSVSRCSASDHSHRSSPRADAKGDTAVRSPTKVALHRLVPLHNDRAGLVLGYLFPVVLTKPALPMGEQAQVQRAAFTGEFKSGGVKRGFAEP